MTPTQPAPTAATDAAELAAQLQRAVAAITAELGDVSAPIGLVLGSGLGGVANQIEDARRLSFERIPHFAASTVPGHAGQLVAGRWQGKQVLALAGRVHYYEGHLWTQVTLPIRVLALLGVQVLVVTNAAGAVHTALQPGDLMLMTDHINLTGGNPLIGANDGRLGPRFPDMTCAYDVELRQLALQVAAERAIALRQGVYCGLTGPSYETPAEIRMLSLLGADVVGMSTVSETIVARHMGVRVLGLSCVTNLGAGLGAGTLDHGHVADVANDATARMTALVAGFVAALPPMVAQSRPSMIAQSRSL
ncbi:MAG: purine-nucleoside phosphorylase [Myxococcales bacterium]|nr:purine-nucleoside phosphorylase [Myxococcales bacterium]